MQKRGRLNYLVALDGKGGLLWSSEIGGGVVQRAPVISPQGLLYLVTEALLMEAHEVEEKPVATLVLFAGFLTFWGIQLMGH